jgi:hypothetical protein
MDNERVPASNIKIVVIVLAVFIILFLLFVQVGIPVLQRLATVRDPHVTALHRIYIGMAVYASEHKGRAPAINDSFWKESENSSYALNSAIADTNIFTLPADVVVLYENDQSQKGKWVSFGNGQSRFVKAKNIPALRWKP